MSMLYDHNRKRIICRWEEPTKVVMNKKEGFINRSRMITVKVDDNGKLNSKDRKRHKNHPLFPHINRFNRQLNRLDNHPAKHEGYTCAACGSKEDVAPHFDPATQAIVWLCPRHAQESPRTDA